MGDRSSVLRFIVLKILESHVIKDLYIVVYSITFIFILDRFFVAPQSFTNITLLLLFDVLSDGIGLNDI